MSCVLVLFANVNLNRDKYCRSYVSVSVRSVRKRKLNAGRDKEADKGDVSATMVA